MLEEELGYYQPDEEEMLIGHAYPHKEDELTWKEWWDRLTKHDPDRPDPEEFKYRTDPFAKY